MKLVTLKAITTFTTLIFLVLNVQFLSGTVTVTSSQGWIQGGNEPSKLVDGNLATSWMSWETSTSLTFTLSSAEVWVQYSITSATDRNKDPYTWTLLGSNDNLQWTQLDSKTGITWNSTNETKTFSISNSTAYLYYKWAITNHYGTAMNLGVYDTYAAEFSYSVASSTPTSSFTYAATGRSVAFTNTSTNATSYSWDFGDGTSSTTASPTHLYATPGTYSVTLTSTGSSVVTSNQSITVSSLTPTPAFTYTANGLSISLTNSSSNAVSYSWDFGDGNTSTSTSPSHTYASAGNYTVTLTATSADGTTASTNQSVNVVATPTANYTYTANGLSLTFTNTSTNATSYSWDFGDGTAASTSTSPTHTFASAGSYTVVLTATNSGGSNQKSSSISVSAPSSSTQTIFLDFGTVATSGNWNNVSAVALNTNASLIDNSGASTGYTFTITTAFGAPNSTGTASPTAPASSIFPATATQDFFYCTVNGVFTLTGLDVNKAYTFDVFASRAGVSPVDNREGVYTAAGLTSGNTSLNATNNTGNYATISNIKPDATGKITFTVSKGANNTNTNGYFYINALRITGFTPTTSSNDNFRSTASGTWSSSSTWQSSHDNTNWFTATASPTSAATAVTIQNGHTIAVDANAITPSLTLNTGSALTVNPGKQLTVSTTLVNNGTLNLNSDASNGTATIITPSSVSGSGNVNVQQHLTTGRNWYVSSPVSAATSGVITTAGNSLWSYDELNTGNVLWNSVTATNVTLNPMQGYVTSELADGVVTFTGGSLNNGNMSVVLNRTENGKTNRGYNLVGNPYPSYLDWAQASANSTNLGTSMWYRTKSPGYVFATYNATGNAGTNGATQYIPPMQAFWVYVKPALDLSTTTGTLAITNVMRSHESGTNRLKVQTSNKESQKLLRLQVTDGIYSDEAVIYFNTQALDEFDTYDSPKRANGNPVPDIYTVINKQNLAINGLCQLQPNQQITLGLKTVNNSTYSIRATEINNFGTDTKIILKDNFLNTEFDLSNGLAYELTPEINLSDTSRFSVIFKSQSIVNGVELTNALKNISTYTNDNQQIVIRTNDNTNVEYSVRVINSLGLVIENHVQTQSSFISKKLPVGVYLVEIKLNGKSIVRKISII